MRVERDRVGELEPAHLRSSPVAEDGEAAVGRVHVQPHAVSRADLGEPRQRVDGAGVRRARRLRRRRADAGLRRVGLDRGGQRLRDEAVIGVDRQHAHVFRPEPEHARARAGDRVRLFR